MQRIGNIWDSLVSLKALQLNLKERLTSEYKAGRTPKHFYDQIMNSLNEVQYEYSVLFPGRPFPFCLYVSTSFTTIFQSNQRPELFFSKIPSMAFSIWVLVFHFLVPTFPFRVSRALIVFSILPPLL